MDGTGYRAADRLLRRLLRCGGGWQIVLLLAGLAGTAAYLTFPAVLGEIIDAVLHGRAAPRYALAACAMVVAFVVADAVSELAVTRATARTTAWLRHHLLDHVLALGPRRPAALGPGEVSGRLVGNVAEAARITPMAAWCVDAVLPSLGGVVALVLIDPLLGAAFLVVAPVLMVVMRRLTRRSSVVASRYLEVQGAIGGLLVSTVAGARTIAAGATQRREAQRVLAGLPDLRHHGWQMWRTQASIAAASAVCGPLVEVVVLAVAGVLLSVHRISAGELIAASQYVLLAAGLPAPLSMLARFSRARAGAARVAEVTAVEPPGYGGLALPAGGAGRLEFRGVTVYRPGLGALTDINLVVPAGGLVAVVGRSGAGKSTLAALAGRLLDPDSGAVLLDGVPLTELSRAELRRAVAYGFERPVLVGETVGDAVTLGCPPGYADRLVAAARSACADEFVRRLPAGYATPMTDAPLSGGEAQRLGLARAFVRPARLLVLDDATSNVDTVTELRIGEVLTATLGGRTRLMVAHRVATAARADLVAWLDAGRVRRVGPHRDLWQDPAYRRVFAP